MKRFRKICSAVLCLAVTLSVAGFSASAADGVSDTQIENLQDKIYNGKATRADITRVTKRLGDEIAGVYGFSISKQRQPNEQAR